MVFQRLYAFASIGALVAGLLPTPASAQCAMCRTLLGTPEGQQLVAGFREGILLLIAAPFLAFGTIAVLAVRAQRRRDLSATKSTEIEVRS